MKTLAELMLSTSPSDILLVALIKASVLLALAQWVVSSVPRLSAAARHLILTLALCSFLVIPAVSFVAPRIAVPVVAAERAAVAAPAPGRETPVDPSHSAVSAAPAASTEKPLQLSPSSWLLLIWSVVALFLVARLGVATLRVRSIVNRAAEPGARIAGLFEEAAGLAGPSRPVRVLMSGSVAVPMIAGLRRGTVLLPEAAAEWSDEELRATFIHELGHLQRHDYLSLGILNLVSSLLWFHPQVWIARSRALTEGERACDDLVLARGARASEYASHLLNVARLMPRRERLAAVLAMSRPTQLEGRMYAILSPSVNRKAPGGKLIMASAMGFLLLVGPLAAVQLSAASMAMPAMPAAPETPVQYASVMHSQSSATRVEKTRRGTCSDYNSHFSDAEVTLRQEQTLSYSGHRLEVTASKNGGVSLRRGTGSTYGITVCKTAGGMTDAEAQRTLDQIQAREQGGKLTVTGPGDNEWVAHLIVTVPDGHETIARGKNGPLSVSDVQGTVDVSVTNGPLSLSGASGQITARAKNGPLSIRKMSGDVNAAVENGPLTVDLDGTAWEGGELRASVENGPLSLAIPAAFQTGIDLTTHNQHVPFRCKGDRICGDYEDFNSGMPRAPRKATFGFGAARIFLETGNGPVTITEQ